ncbi:MAG: hypothetical protein NTY85_03375 [Actinobacteria bacterium]|nr:hypothetical protein [Actinomycetota bacterium]
MRLTSKISISALLFALIAPLPAFAAGPPTFSGSWNGSGEGAKSTWSLKSGNVTWSSNFRSPVWNLSLTELKGSLKFSPSKKNHFEIWFVNADEYGGNPDNIVPPAVVVNGDPAGVGSTPNLIYDNRVSIGHATTLTNVGACVSGGNSGFKCPVVAVFSQKGGTLSNYENGDVLAIASYTNGSTVRDVITFTIQASDFPAKELAKTNASTFNGSGTTVEKTYTNTAGKACTKSGQLAHSVNGNLECQKVSGKLVWVEAGNVTNPKTKTNKTRNNCNSKQLSNLENYVTRIEQLQAKISGLEETQKTLRAQIQWFKDNGRTFDEAAYIRKISQNQSEIITAQNSISANVKSFNSVDSICRQNDYELPEDLNVN